MKRKRFVKCTSAVLVLCMILTCISFAFTSVGAATAGNANIAEVSAGSGNDNFSWDNASVYFLLTDRFKNGNTSNDHSYGRATDANGNPLAGWETAPGTFHGGDFAGITQAIKDGYFNDLGINAIWISAPYEQIHGYVDSGKGFAHYSYHGYYVLDYTQTDANFGTAEEFETLVDTAHEHGLRVIMDIVMNHSGYNNVADMETYNYGTLLDGASDFKYRLNDVSEVNSHIDFKSSASDWGRWWGSEWVRSGLPGYVKPGGDDLTRDLEGLPDFITESSAAVDIPPLLKTKWQQEGRLTQETNELDSYLKSSGKTRTVRNSISYWLSTWVRDYGVDGFRCDTAKHVDLASWNTLKTTCADALKQWRLNNPNKPGADWDEDFWMTGECWDHNVGWGYDSYFTEGGFDSMINFETQGGGLLSSSQISGVYNGYASSINTNDKFNALSYLSSHDSTLTRGNMAQLGSAFLLLPGGVQVYYGDETNRPLVSGLAFDGNGGSGHSLRSDMNWDSIDEALLAHWQKVGTFRNNHISVGAGANIDLSSTSGYAFGRTYSKNGISDKVAGCIYASANTNVTIDVSDIWADGQYVVNAYDQSSANVQNGKVTFNSGANGTILIQEPDGRPLMSVEGEAKFKGYQNVTVKLEECESAKCSIDGGNKFIVKNGDTFTIGSTAYDGDTIKITLEGENEKGTSKSTFSFVKVAETGSIDQPTTTPAEKAKIIVKTWDGSAPHAYVWTGESTALNGAWPGNVLTEKDSNGNYVLELDTTASYNVVLNNGSGVQSGDLTGLNGESSLEVLDSSYNSKVISTGSGSGGEVTEDSVIIRVKSYDGSAPHLYLWNDTNKSINGAWPGNVLTEKDEDGNYIFTANNTSTVNAIVNNGSDTNKTGDLTGLSGDVLITITNASCTECKVTKKEIPLSGMELLRKEAREVKIMTASDYTSESFSKVNVLMADADKLIAQGEEADEAAVTDMIAKLQSAKSALKLVQPKLTYAVSGQSTVKGIAVANADVTVNIGGKDYKTVSDDVTGEFAVSGTSVSASSIIKVNVSRNGISADTYTYNMSNGNITNGEQPTSPVIPPVTEPQTTSPATEPTTEPVTDPVAETLKVKATSNVFPTAENTFDKKDGKITVSYKLSANMGAVDASWRLTYDSTKLKFVEANNLVNRKQTVMPEVENVVFLPKTNEIAGNFTNASMVKFNDNADFVTLTFEIIGTGETALNLELEILSLGYVVGNEKMNIASIVDYSKMQDISNVSGFENAKIETSTVLEKNYLRGDVNNDGRVSISDATDIAKYLVSLNDFTLMQKKAADVDLDGRISIKDATRIQKKLAKLIDEL